MTFPRRIIILILCAIIATMTSVRAFPDGAPVDACVKPRKNQPYHGQARTQSLETNPYSVVASSSEYGPGSQITVTIGGDIFKGFFLQARNAHTGEWIGSWAQTPNTNTHPECSAVTHADPREKQQATLIWNAPHNSQGQVYFTGTVLKDYGTFWADLVAQVAQ
ncbi:putative defense protein 3 [Cephus cinctus]|uniref:Defense protein 3 n=1 Tax=Cephus cinctus TaxID=211228 RepID=A0AAJ7FG33_CEPCN|nr:putative defense protein 3 [Cephus cinctus]XP_015590098.1 putative defense protein 3 [Cephus cinctus]XP_024938252.1 putative defense protein 3 [Cephus cinctus]